MPQLLRAFFRAALLTAALAAWHCASFGQAHTAADVPNQRVLNGTLVSDPDAVLGAEYTERINTKLQEIERITGAQVAVVALDQIEGGDLSSFAQQLFALWGIGRALKDDGLLILLVRSQRQVRFEVGYRLEGQLPDVLCHRIQVQDMVPHFKQGEYGEGVLAGVNAVARILSASSSTPGLVVPPPVIETPYWRPQTIALTAITALTAFVCGMFQITTQKPERLRPSSKNLPLSMRYATKGWWLLFVGLPLTFVLAVHFVVQDVHWVVVFVCLYGYGLTLATWHLNGLFTHAANLTQRGMHAAAHRFLKGEQGFWLGMAFLFPIPLALGVWWLGRRAREAREHPRRCPSCKTFMGLLTESEEDAHLSEGAQTEERMGSREHDVWKCPACGATKTESYDVDRDTWQPCPKCKALTERLDSRATLRRASVDAAGEEQLTYVCVACTNKRVVTHDLPRLGQSSGSSSSGSSSSSSSSGSSGSSWGGGSSGGGGSSASW